MPRHITLSIERERESRRRCCVMQSSECWGQSQAQGSVVGQRSLNPAQDDIQVEKLNGESLRLGLRFFAACPPLLHSTADSFLQDAAALGKLYFRKLSLPLMLPFLLLLDEKRHKIIQHISGFISTARRARRVLPACYIQPDDSALSLRDSIISIRPRETTGKK